MPVIGSKKLTSKDTGIYADDFEDVDEDDYSDDFEESSSSSSSEEESGEDETEVDGHDHEVGVLSGYLLLYVFLYIEIHCVRLIG